MYIYTLKRVFYLPGKILSPCWIRQGRCEAIQQSKKRECRFYGIISRGSPREMRFAPRLLVGISRGELVFRHLIWYI